jgi:transposase
MENKKAAIQLCHEDGFLPAEIFHKLKDLDISRDLVARTVKRLNETGTTQDRPRSGRPRSVRTPALVNKVYHRLRRNPQQSPNKLATKLKTSRTTMRRIIKDDLGLRPYKKRKVHGLTCAAKQKRLIRSKDLLERFANSDLKNLVFSDEKLFTVQQSLNLQNDRVYAAAFADIPEEMRTVQRFSHPSSIMIWGAVSKKAKFPLVFVEPGVKVNNIFYREQILEPVVKVQGQVIFKDQHWVFQQDSAPAHKAKINQAWCESEIPDFVSSQEWPPNSPDLNPMDYAIWGILEAKVNARVHRSLDSLKSAIQKEWDALPMKTVRKSIDAFPARLRAVIHKKGGRFE